MRTTRLLTVVLGLVLVFAAGCGTAETNDVGNLLERASQNLSGGTWENPDDPGNALLFRPNGTGQSYIAARDVTGEITWGMELRDARVLLSWSYVLASSGDAQEWIIEIDEDKMKVWPQKGSQPILDPDSDQPFILLRAE